MIQNRKETQQDERSHHLGHKHNRNGGPAAAGESAEEVGCSKNDGARQGEESGDLRPLLVGWLVGPFDADRWRSAIEAGVVVVAVSGQVDHGERHEVIREFSNSHVDFSILVGPEYLGARG